MKKKWHSVIDPQAAWSGVGDTTEGAPAPRDYQADTLYWSATLAERIRHNRIDENKSTLDGMGGKPDYEGIRALIRTLPQVEGGSRIRERKRATHSFLSQFAGFSPSCLKRYPLITFSNTG